MLLALMAQSVRKKKAKEKAENDNVAISALPRVAGSEQQAKWMPVARRKTLLKSESP